MLAAAAVATVVACVPPSAFASGGSANPQIAGLQVALRAWGYYNGPVDGIAGPMTAGGLHAFQRRVGLPTGVADVRTRVGAGRSARRCSARACSSAAASAGTCRCSSSCFGARTSTTARSTGTSTPRRSAHCAGSSGAYISVSMGSPSCDALRDRYPCTRSGAPEDRARRAVLLRRSPRRLPDRDCAPLRHLGRRARARQSPRFLALPAHRQAPAGPTFRADRRACAPRQVGNAVGVDPNLVRALAWMESGYQTKLVSSAGARGVMQLLPTTRQYVSDVVLRKPIPAGVDGDVKAGVALIKHLLGAFQGNQKLALAAWYRASAPCARTASTR